MRLSRFLLSTALLFGACSTVPNPALSAPHSRTGKANGTILSAPTPVSSITGVSSGYGTDPVLAVVPYDTSIGNGVDASGFAALPLRSGAHYTYLNSATGNDANDCTAARSPTTPKATESSAVSCIVTGEGDQVLAAEGTAYATFPTFLDKFGFSLVYPTAVRSYDPADPTNTAKFGRASGNNRPVFGLVATDPAIYSPGNVNAQNYMAFQGLALTGGNVSGAGIGVLNAGDGMLWENDLFAYMGLGIGIYTSPTAHHWIFRNDGFYGNWDSDPSHLSQALYIDGCTSVTIEDDVFWHNGWKIGGAGRDDTSDGASIFRHPIYQQAPTDATTRRNMFVDGAEDGGSYRGNSTVALNVAIDNPIGIYITGGPHYDTDRPTGVAFEVAYNAIFGDANVTSTQPLGWGIATENGKPGSAVHHNLIARSRSPGGNPTYDTRADFNQPSYVDYHDNTSYLWSAAGSVDVPAGVYSPAQIFETFENNLWDDPTSGSNTNSTGHVFPSAYLAPALYAALGYADKTSFMTYVSAHPESHPARVAHSLLFTGYGIASDVTAPVLTSPTSSAVTTTTATIGASTNEVSGVLYGEVTTSASAPSNGQVRGQRDASGAPISNTLWGLTRPLSTGAKTFALTALLPATTYYPYFVQEDASGNVSSVLSGSSFTTSALVSSQWASSTDTPPSSATWVLSNGGLTGTRSSGAGADGLIRGNVGRTAASATAVAKVTIGAMGGADIIVGLCSSTVATNTWAGDTGCVGYDSNNPIYKNTAGVGLGATFTAGDVIEEDISGGFITFKKNGTVQGSAIDISAMGTVYVSVSTSSTGAAVTLDPTGW